ncbi:TIGR03790 family protein [Rhodocyclus tenuis]|uniref:TIGR03790 family protein n=1 Tax=Rhodocyclus tenuis TaxID=1066 RepID=UPI001904C5BF|nr:TIGR03790 family protein [Rhodocyclus tenuis]MBK1678937.1 TIGR03790 family protein [Rhodocyclus tenuis]
MSLLRLVLLAASLCSCLLLAPASASPQLLLPHSGLLPDELMLIVNEDDPLSRQVAAYYQKARELPERNVIRLHFAPGRSALSPDEFMRLRREIEAATPPHIQAYAVAWTQPYQVGCMSLTAALAFGFDERFCSRQCGKTAASPYFNSPTLYPATELHMRPAMLLAGQDFAQVKALIDRGVAADGSFPTGTAYLLSTADSARNVRAAGFARTAQALAGVFPVEVLHADALTERNDVLFYFTGVAQVLQLDTLQFQPGALADHLTSFGGRLSDSTQMSSLRWLEAGATASYGTVSEPCNHLEKFPLPALAMLFYAGGSTAIEAYWKSVAWPGEGVFIGEPLARPFAPSWRETAPGEYELHLYSASAGKVQLAFAASPMGPFKPLPLMLALQRGANRLVFSLPREASGYVKMLWK